jgi:hypothetical protein
LLCRKCCFRCVDFEVLVFGVEFCQSHCGHSFNDTERDSFVAQRDDTQHGVCRKAHEVSRIDLYLEAAILAGRDGVALDQRVIEPDALPVLVAAAFQVDFAVDQTRAHNAGFNVVFVGRVVIIVGAGGYCD